MSALSRIRNHPKMLIAFIGFAIVLFVLGIIDNRSNGNPDAMAVVDGDQILRSDFEVLRDKNLNNMKRNYGNNLTAAQTLNVNNSTLEQLIKDNIMNKEYAAAGITVSAEELFDQFFGDDPHQWVVQNFTDAEGNFDRDALVNTRVEMDNDNVPEAYRQQWYEFEKEIKENRLKTKFDNLIKASYFVPTPLAKMYYENKNVKASADVVALRYSSIPDSTVTVTDKDNKQLYEEVKYKHETDESRSIEYVVFEIKPSAEDTEDARQKAAEKKEDFAAAEDAIAFVRLHSSKPYDSTWMGRSDVPAAIESVIFDEGNKPGFVYGPYFDKDAYNLVRIMDFQNRADSLKASHILIPFEGALYSESTNSKDRAKQIADSLLNVLKKNSKNTELFAELATKMSTDKGSAEKGGDLGWFTDGTMVPTFNEFVMNTPVNQMGVVESPFGFHVIKVTDKTSLKPKARIAVLSQDVYPSTKTQRDVFQMANDFSTNNRTYEQFSAAADAAGLSRRTMPKVFVSTPQITGVENSREIVQWAFNKKTKLNEVSGQIFECNDKYVVAVVTDIIPEGYVPMDKILDQYKSQILNRKKGEIAVEKMKACGTDYDRMVKELGAERTTVTDLSMDSRAMGNFGVENDIVGTILAMSENEEIGPVAGYSSAFIVKNVKIQGVADDVDLSSTLRDKTAQFNNKVVDSQHGVYAALKNKAKIKDNRIWFY